MSSDNITDHSALRPSCLDGCIGDKSFIPPIVERPIRKIPLKVMLQDNFRVTGRPDEDFYYTVTNYDREMNAPLYLMCTIMKDGVPLFQKPLDSPSWEHPGAFVSLTYSSVRFPGYGYVEIIILLVASDDNRNAKYHHTVIEYHVDEHGEKHCLQEFEYPDDSITSFRTVNNRGIEVLISIPEDFMDHACTPTINAPDVMGV